MNNEQKLIHSVITCSNVFEARWIEGAHADSWGRDYVFGDL